jgi:uncharacterized protein with PIN domain
LPLHPIDKAHVAADLPLTVRADYERFSFCDGCGRVFWEGSHWRRMRAMLDGLLL